MYPGVPGSARAAVGAHADQGEMAAIDLEAELRPHGGKEGLQRAGGDLQDPAALLADEVLVVVLGQVEDCRAVGEMRVIDDPELFEGVERPIDG